jgi:hypothetical protein
MQFVEGQMVIWTYRHPGKLRGRPGNTCLVTGEVVQIGERRVRIRITCADGTHAVRWVKLSNLRLVQPGEPMYSYPQFYKEVSRG